MNTVVLALLVAVVAALFYYPTFVRIPSAEEVSGNTAQRAATPTQAMSSAPSAQAQQTNAGSAAAPAGQVPSAPTASAVASPSQTPQASTAQVVELPPATGKKVIIVGGGLAGMSAAIEAVRAGAHVDMLEKTIRWGGNSEKASSGMNAARTAAQIKLNLKDSVEEFYKDTIASGHGLSNEELVDVMTKESASAYDFLSSFDIDLNTVTKLGGHSRARTHRPSERVTGNVGWEITSTLSKYLATLPRDRLTMKLGARLTSLVVEDGRVVGVKYTKIVRDEKGHETGEELAELRGDSVILATGGYSRADDLLRKYIPKIVDLPTTNGPFAEGDGIKVAEQINASLIHMDQVQLHPTSFVSPKDPLAKTKFLAPEALRGLGGILINQDGKRFVNELDTRDKVTQAIFKNCKPLIVEQEVNGQMKTVVGPVVAHLIMTDEAVKLFPNLQFYQAKGFLHGYLGVEEMAEGLELPGNTLKQTFAEYHECFVRQGNCADPFGKKDFPFGTRSNDVFHAMMITPAIHYTMGGLEIDKEAHVLRAAATTEDKDEAAEAATATKEIIPGLFAAGEVTGGVHGANRLGGNSLLECVVFGRRAGRFAAAFTETATAPEVTSSSPSSTPVSVV